MEIVAFAAEHLPALARFSERVWRRPRGEAFYRWRHLDCPGHEALLALRGGECVAVVGAMRRRYRLGLETREVLETCDWYALPELLNSGIGIRVLRSALERAECAIAVGGTDFTLRLLPKLGWRRVAESRPYQLALTSAARGRALASRSGLPEPLARAAGALAGAWLRPRRVPSPAGGEVREVAGPEAGVLELYVRPEQHTVQLPDPAHHRWLVAGRDYVGQLVTLEFSVAGELVGWALGRLYATGTGCEAALVDIFAPRPERKLYAWMVSSLVHRLAEAHPDSIRAAATCPVLGAALRTNRFLPGRARPVAFWSAGEATAAEPLHLTGSTADTPLLPYLGPPGPAGPPGTAA